VTPAAAGAQDDRRDHDVKTIEAAGRDETRDRVRAAFDQHALEAAPGQRGEDRRRRHRPVRAAARRVPRRRAAPAGGLGGHQQRRAPSHANTRAPGRHPAARIDDDPRRIGARHMPHGELRVVGERRPDADHHDVDERAQAVENGRAPAAR